MIEWQADVAKFNFKMDIPVGAYPRIPNDIRRPILRRELNKEEYDELWEAMILGDIVAIADGIADLIYVLLGAALEYGIDMGPIWDEVQRTNMMKEGGGIRGDGKILKPEGWLPPDISGLLKQQGWQG